MKLHEVVEQLKAPFLARDLKFKPQAVSKDGGRALAFPHIDARSVADRLDGVVGPQNWSDSYSIIPGSHVAVLCRLTVLGVTKEGIGEALPSERQGEELYKAAESDSLKRAAVKFGVGRYLYALPKHWLAFDGKKFTEPYPLPDGQGAVAAEAALQPYQVADNRPSGEQMQKMQDFWRRLLQLGRSEAELVRELEDQYGAGSLEQLNRSQAFQWFNHSRAVLNSLYLRQQRLPVEQEPAVTTTITRARRRPAGPKAG
jgi:hypothetical protein